MADSTAQPPSKKTKTRTSNPRRIGSEKSATRVLILDMVEQLMLQEGYAAVTSRRVAKELDLKPSAVHYYFPTTDDLFLAVYQRSVENEQERQEQIYQSADSLQALWNSYRHRSRNALVLEFMALANHRKVIRNEIARYTDQIRQRRAEVLANLLTEDQRSSAEGLSVLLIALARTLVMEEGLGISRGHAEAIDLTEQLLAQLQAPGLR